MRILPFILLTGLMGCSDSEVRKSSEQVLELVPFGTPLASAQQTMEQRHFKCSVVSYSDPSQMTNTALLSLWRQDIVKGGQHLQVTNVARLRCERTNCLVVFTVLNGETTGAAVKGKF